MYATNNKDSWSTSFEKWEGNLPKFKLKGGKLKNVSNSRNVQTFHEPGLLSENRDKSSHKQKNTDQYKVANLTHNPGWWFQNGPGLGGKNNQIFFITPNPT